MSDVVVSNVVSDVSVQSTPAEVQSTPAEAPAEVVAEAPAEVQSTPAEAPAEDPLHKRFQALSKREKWLSDKEKQQKNALAQREQEIETKLSRLAHLEDIEKQLETFQNAEPPKVATLEEKVAALEKQLKDREDAEVNSRQQYEQQRKQQEVVQAIDSYKDSISKVVVDVDTYELFNDNKEQAIEMAMEVALQYFGETGQIADPKQIAEYVEEYLTEQATTQFQRMQSLKKLRAREQPPVKETIKQPVVSVTNSKASGSALKANPNAKWDTDASKERAAKLLKWNE